MVTGMEGKLQEALSLFLYSKSTNQLRRIVQSQASDCLQRNRSLELGGVGWRPVELRQDLGYHCPYHLGSPLTLQSCDGQGDVKDCGTKESRNLEHCVPVTCVLMSILDLGHPLRGESNMGHRCTAKPVLCFAFIHLAKREKTLACGWGKMSYTHTSVFT